MSKYRYSKEAIQNMLDRHDVIATTSTLGGYGFKLDGKQIHVNEYHFQDKPEVGHFSVYFVLHSIEEVEQLLFGVNDEGGADGQV